MVASSGSQFTDQEVVHTIRQAVEAWMGRRLSQAEMVEQIDAVLIAFGRRKAVASGVKRSARRTFGGRVG
jgi:hypothetical protein